MRQNALITGRLQSFVEVIYEFVNDMLGQTIGPDGRKYFPFMFTIFTLVLAGNLLGMVPYSFTFAQHELHITKKYLSDTN